MALVRRRDKAHTMRHHLLLLVFPLMCLALSVPPPTVDSEARDASAKYSTPATPLRVLKADTSAKATGQNDFTCGPEKPCVNGACCGEDGWCGYGPDFCEDGCQSNCDATAECGKFASDKGATCPLNVCCSEYGFCGTTHDFCKDGCQSNCEQPKPNGSPSNSQNRVIGYWEGWNSDKACGTMGIGEIPVQMLTHLIVAFAYISQDFKITNMDGLSSDVYRDAGNVKARNPNVKVMIALGGWTFSDPGPWQSVFPDMTSSKENRATFIKNLMGFLGEYGYDGVDFDWEYPGADDRGGSKADAANYVALMKELREAIGDKDIIVTFTAPTSYWYLRHFDVPGMAKYVDWINLMSYDLHGVWDSSNPIGSQVLSHTNLTEIDAALDLFWRVEVEPSSIVLGIGFYGRSFALEDASCWKPGCSFSGPGEAGRCSNTAGILSYREIQDIISDTGATAYLDKDAQARYMVYSGNNWISFDDEKTFQAKIDYANKIGLSGLMVWAVDLDDGKHTALSAISGNEYLGGGNVPFSLVDLDHIFPEALRPAKDSNPDYGLVTFGGSGSGSQVDPKGSPFGLFVAGDGPAATKLRKRHGQREPFTFLECPSDVSEKPQNHTQIARVACFNDDVEGCFQLLQGGVEDTLVEMPDECAPGKLARAISLDVASEQDFPFQSNQKRATSEIYDFSFDFDVSHAKRDEKSTSIRVDYSNANGYWSSAVDSPGVESKALARRYYSDDFGDWRVTFDTDNMDFSEDGAAAIKEDVSMPVYWETTVNDCYVDGDEYMEGIAVYVEGDFDVNMWYGFSMVADDLHSDFVAEEANGFLKIDGTSDLTLGIGGIGALSSENMSGSKPKRIHTGGHQISGTKTGGSVYFQPWYEVGYSITTYGGEDDGASGYDEPVGFNGNASVRVLTDFGNFETTYPDPDKDQADTVKPKNEVEVSSEGRLYSTYGTGGQIFVDFTLNFGLDVEYFRKDGTKVNLPTLITSSVIAADFTNHAEDDSNDARACLEIDAFTTVTQYSENGDSVGWDDSETIMTLGSHHSKTGKKCYENVEPTNSKRSLSEQASTNTTSDLVASDHVDSDVSLLAPRAGKGRAGFEIGAGEIVSPDLFIGLAAAVFRDNGLGNNVLDCDDYSCTRCVGDESDPEKCCGCTSMMETYRFKDIPACDACQKDDGEWPFGKGSSTESSLQPRASGKATLSSKKVSICEDFPVGLGAPYRYPAFPGKANWPWDGIEKGKWDSISRYWGNSSADCTDWSVDTRTVADWEYLKSGKYARASYQTEHVFEGQLIGDFFTWWLAEGKVKNQSPPTTNAQQIRNCTWTEDYILDISAWKIQSSTINVNFFSYLLAELGSETNLDRLAIYKSRPNRMKGNVSAMAGFREIDVLFADQIKLFSGIKTISVSTYNELSMADQLQKVKEFGMTFQYLNDPEVWEMFCDTYEVIYEKMVEFDNWYKKNKHGTSDLQSEWKAYIKETLSSIVNRSKADFDMYYQTRKARSPNDKPFYNMWETNKIQNRPLIKLDRKCKYW